MHPILKAHIEKREFHHAYLLCGEVEVCQKMAEETAKAILSEDNLESSPDFSRRRFGLFGINDSHNLTSWAATKSFSGQGKVFVLEVFSFNVESSNALLKTLEEPNDKTHFFIIVSSVESVMPTLRSRLTVIDLRLGSSASKSDLEAELPSEFLKSLPNKRLEMVKKIIAKSDEENELFRRLGRNSDLASELSESSANKQKAAPQGHFLFFKKNNVVQFLSALEFLLEKEFRSHHDGKNSATALEELSRSQQFISDRGASPKIILEHLALALPVFF